LIAALRYPELPGKKLGIPIHGIPRDSHFSARDRTTKPCQAGNIAEIPRLSGREAELSPEIAPFGRVTAGVVRLRDRTLRN
jgi:hypothetical protein